MPWSMRMQPIIALHKALSIGDLSKPCIFVISVCAPFIYIMSLCMLCVVFFCSSSICDYQNFQDLLPHYLPQKPKRSLLNSYSFSVPLAFWSLNNIFTEKCLHFKRPPERYAQHKQAVRILVYKDGRLWPKFYLDILVIEVVFLKKKK